MSPYVVHTKQMNRVQNTRIVNSLPSLSLVQGVKMKYFRVSCKFDIQRTVMYSYNRSQRDALFLTFIFVKNST